MPQDDSVDDDILNNYKPTVDKTKDLFVEDDKGYMSIEEIRKKERQESVYDP